MDDDAPGNIVLLGEIVFVHQNHPTQELIHYNFSAEWAIQSFMLALCMLFTDGIGIHKEREVEHFNELGLSKGRVIHN